MATHKIYYSASPIASIEKLAKTLNFTEAFIKKVAQNPKDFYTTFQKNVKGKERTLAEPHPALKTLQKRIITRIFCHIEFPSYLHGGIKTEGGRDFVSNASSHSKSQSAIALDIKSFFPSITTKHVERVFSDLFHFPPEVSSTLAQIATLDDSIPQGAPTSSYIANLVMWEKEYRLVAKLEGQGLIYTRLIDDMTISSIKRIPEKQVTKIINDVASMLTYYSFCLHPDKKKIYSRSNPQELMLITGLWLNRGSPRMLKEKRAEIAREVAVVEQQAKSSDAVFDAGYHQIHATSSGKVALLKRLGHSRADRLRKILKENEPKFSEEDCHKIKILVDKFCAKKMDDTKLGYLKNFYKFQHNIAIIKRTDPVLAKQLQSRLNKKRPTTTIKDIYG